LAHIKLIPQDARPFRLGPLAKTIESSGTQAARAFLWLREPKVVSSGQTRALIPFISNSNCGWVDPAGSFILNYLSAGRCTTATTSNFIGPDQQMVGNPRTNAIRWTSSFFVEELIRMHTSDPFNQFNLQQRFALGRTRLRATEAVSPGAGYFESRRASSYSRPYFSRLGEGGVQTEGSNCNFYSRKRGNDLLSFDDVSLAPCRATSFEDQRNAN